MAGKIKFKDLSIGLKIPIVLIYAYLGMFILSLIVSFVGYWMVG